LPYVESGKILVEGTESVISRCDDARRAISIRPFVRWMAATAMSLGLIAALMAGSGQPAQAEPPLTVAEAKALIAQLETDAEAIDQEYVEIDEQLDKGRAKLKLKQADVKAQAKRVERLKFQVGQVALAQFQNRNLDTAAQLFVTSDTEGFLSQISTVEKVSENQNSVLQEYQQQEAAMAALELSAKTDLAALSEQEKQLKALRAASDKKIADSKKVLAKLSAEEQQKIRAEERRAADDARAEAESDTETNATSTAKEEEKKENEDDDEPAPSGGSKGARALAYARAQLGDPYRFASAGPDAFDCSGLTSAAWKSVGVSLPRSSRSQYGAGSPVSRSNLQPGDLVFFYSPISHVALYAGNGQIIHAPRPGKSVEYSSMNYMPYTGARRPG
jgi:cell wall-associated NlpC family hydrolase